MYQTKRNYNRNSTKNISQIRQEPSCLDGVTNLVNNYIKNKNKMIVIGITGKAGTGKDTVAEFIKNNERKTEIVSFAEKLKVVASIITGLDPSYFDSDNPDREKIHPKFNKSPRTILKLLGTDCVRNIIHEDVWLNHVKEKYCHIKNKYPKQKFFVITDVRFNNEAAWVNSIGGTILQLERDVPKRRQTDANHPTEHGIDSKYITRTIFNKETLEQLNDRVSELTTDLIKKKIK